MQIAKHYVINAYEEQLEYDANFVAEDFNVNAVSNMERQKQLERYSESFPIELVLYQTDTQEYLHTFSRNETLTLNQLLDQSLTSDQAITLDSRLAIVKNVNDDIQVIVVSEELPIQYLQTTLWFIVILLSLLVGFFIWGFGNRLYENYVNPIRKASDTAKSLAEGNYSARIHDAPYGIVSELSQSINTLARNLEYITSKYRNQNDRLKTVVNNMESGLLLINEKGLTRLANEPFIRNFTNQSSVLGEIYYDVIENKALNDALQEVVFMERKKQLTIETNDGDYFEVYLAPIRNNYDTWKGVVVVCHDITKIKQLENIRKDFVANVSHELRTPITSIQGFVETLLDGNEHDEEIVKKFLRIIDKESRRLNALIEDLLELSTIEKDDFSLTKTQFNVSDLMEDVDQVVEKQLELKDLTRTIQVEGDLQLYADYNRLYQLVLNLYSNAIQYTPEGGYIQWSVVSNEGFVRFRIKDNGIGIPKKNQGRIFERFYRVDQDRSRQTGGTGLGLSIVKHIVEAHEGMIELESEEGEGTTITVSIPQKI
ncbi:two-component system histidine kinase PnpS [Piscibacillus sp. B03]|uniref:two-component system histidine kinase PnpS n=1 Tax=Piscibacillus sp. B03 TaxID=3457430 RepID=UPI003FCC9C53